VPLLSLNDNPGNMVGPEAEKTALVRHCCRTYLIGANLSIPTFFVMTRKSYGLGKLAMTGGSMRVGMFAVAWPKGAVGRCRIRRRVVWSRFLNAAALGTDVVLLSILMAAGLEGMSPAQPLKLQTQPIGRSCRMALNAA